MAKTVYLHKISAKNPVKLAFKIGLGFFLGKAVVTAAEIALVKYLLDKNREREKQEDSFETDRGNIIDISFGNEEAQDDQL